MVIVSWNACAHLRRCLSSLEATAGALLVFTGLALTLFLTLLLALGVFG